MSTMYIDFGVLKSKVKIEDVVKFLNMQLRLTRSGTMRGSCPKCRGNDTMAVTPSHVRNDGTVGSYYCHSQKIGGDLIGLAAHVLGTDGDMDMKEAANQIAQHFRVVPTAQAPVKREKPPQAEQKSGFDPEAYVSRLDPANEALAALGVSPETFKLFKAGYSSNGVHRGKLALPLHDQGGKLIGHFARSLKNEDPLLSFVGSQNPANHIFGSHLVQAGDLYIASDPIQVLTAHENGETNVVAFLTDGMTREQWEMLAIFMDEKKIERSFFFH